MPRGEKQLGGHVEGQLAHTCGPVLFEILDGKRRREQAHERLFGSRPPRNTSLVFKLVAISDAEAPSKENAPFEASFLDFPLRHVAEVVGVGPTSRVQQNTANLAPSCRRQ